MLGMVEMNLNILWGESLPSFGENWAPSDIDKWEIGEVFFPI